MPCLADDCLTNVPALMAALARVQGLATSWVTVHRPELQGYKLQQDLAGHLPLHETAVDLLPFAYQVRCCALTCSVYAAQWQRPASGSAVPALAGLMVRSFKIKM